MFWSHSHLLLLSGAICFLCKSYDIVNLVIVFTTSVPAEDDDAVEVVFFKTTC